VASLADGPLAGKFAFDGRSEGGNQVDSAGAVGAGDSNAAALVTPPEVTVLADDDAGAVLPVRGPLTDTQFSAAVAAVTSAFGDPTRRQI
jgi:hypothetical protein